MSDPLDPLDLLGLLADQSSPRANSVKATADNDDGGLKKVNMDKFAVKCGSKTTAKPASDISTVEDASGTASSNGVSANNRGLGFGVAVTATTANTNTKVNSALDVLDLLDKSAAASSSASDALDDMLFGNSTTSKKPTAGKGLGAGAGGESDDIFSSFKGSSSIRNSAPSSSSPSSGAAAASSSLLRTGLTSDDDHRISDLKASTQFMSKEDDQSLEYSMFGISTVKQAVQKQNASISSKAKAVATTLGGSGLDEASADLAMLDNLFLDDETVFLQQKKAAAAASLTQDLFKSGSSSSSRSTKTPAAAVEVDMSTLDLDAYLAANSGAGAGGGGGLFD